MSKATSQPGYFVVSVPLDAPHPANQPAVVVAVGQLYWAVTLVESAPGARVDFRQGQRSDLHRIQEGEGVEVRLGEDPWSVGFQVVSDGAAPAGSVAIFRVDIPRA